MRSFLLVVIITILGSGCGSGSPQSQGPSSGLPPVGVTGTSGQVVKARSLIPISTGSPQVSQLNLMNLLIPSALASSSYNIPISTTVASSTTFTLNDTTFIVPTDPTPFVINDFGHLKVTTLDDNNLDVCGTSGTDHCGTATIQIYTTGTAGAGLWNSADGYGLPIEAGETSPYSTVGLDVANAAIMQQIAIPTTQHTVVTSDFSQLNYDVKVDFTNAGTGTYATTLVLEYVLSP